MQNPGQLSADGKWRWDGRQWMPSGAALPNPAQAPVLPVEYTRPTNQLAIIALIASILSWVLFPVAGALVGVVTGHIARGQIRRSGESGAGLAMAALVIGYAHLVAVIVGGLVWLLFIGGFLVALFGSGNH
ncbi:MAG TPA: DUF4190 domain-containing protein [Candidatus Dormibacteraeota bacterium]|nr:DUF4190 domain-containing protein [Candidatus Dormibacteraeota bacterium]